MYRFYIIPVILLLFMPTSEASTNISVDHVLTETFADKDRDGISDYRDNCPDKYNPHQDDSDADGIGDVCDDDDCECSNEHEMIYVCQEGRTRRVYCSALSDPNTFCGPCEDQKKKCTECEEDERGNITLCLIASNNKQRSVKGRCEDLQKYFNPDGTLSNDRDQCGPCNCAMIGDVDTDGDGACDTIDECPNNPLKVEAGMCGCDKYDTDGDWVCDEDDVCPGSNDKYDADGDGVPDGCDVCEGSDDKADADNDGIPDGCDECADSASGDSDGDGVCDDLDICPGGDDLKDVNEDGIPDDCETHKCAVSGNSQYEWIQDVKINSWFNLTNENGGYAEFSDPALMFFKGDLIKLWLTPGYIDRVAELSMAIFVDWNGDGDFDDEGERVYDVRALRESGIDMVIPDYAVPGRICARFIVNYGRITTACDPCIDGEVEDYVLVIKEKSCDQLEESFDYDLDAPLQGLSGGWGWTSAWRGMVSGNPSARILQNSLSSSQANSAGQKLGILTPPGTSYGIQRELNLTNNDLWMSFMYQRRGGAGSMDFIIGTNDESVSIDSDGILTIAGTAGPTIPTETPSFIVLNLKQTDLGQAISAWVNPSATSALIPENATIFNGLSIDQTIDQLTMNFHGEHGTIATDHYIDELTMGCNEASVVFPNQGGNPTTDVEQSLSIAPNPISQGVNAGITLSNASFFQGTLNVYSMTGELVISQSAVAGLNVISTSAMQPGIYVLEIVTDQGTITEQLVVQS